MALAKLMKSHYLRTQNDTNLVVPMWEVTDAVRSCDLHAAIALQEAKSSAHNTNDPPPTPLVTAVAVSQLVALLHRATPDETLAAR